MIKKKQSRKRILRRLVVKSPGRWPCPLPPTEWRLCGKCRAGFSNKLTAAVARAVAGIFSTTAGSDAIRAADTPPTRAALDRRRDWLLTAVTVAPLGTPRGAYSPRQRGTTPAVTASPAGSKRPPRMASNLEKATSTPATGPMDSSPAHKHWRRLNLDRRFSPEIRRCRVGGNL
jgi:hypothetical protein